MEPSLRAHFGLSATGFGILSAFYYYAYVPLQVPVGVMLDRFGPRILITIACAICVLGCYLFTATDIFWVGATARFLMGFGSAFAFVGVLKLATIWLPEDKLGMVSGMASALGTIGAMLGDNIMAKFVLTSGWKATINWSAAIGVVLTVILWFGIRDKKHNQKQSGSITTFKKSIVDLYIIAKNPQIWLNGMFGCLVYLPTTVFAELWGIPYLQHAHGLSKTAASFANSMVFMGFMCGAPLMGFISDKLKKRRAPMRIGASLAAFLMLILVFVENLTASQITILLFAMGLFYSSQCLVFAVGRELSPREAAGTAMAMTNMIVMLGAMFLQPIVGKLLDYSVSKHIDTTLLSATDIASLHDLYMPKDYQFALSIIPIGMVIAAFITFFIKETYADIKE
jgi:sugar phosphate permease